MQKYLAGLGVTALLLTGCGSAASSPTPTVTVTETQSAAPVMSDDEVYIAGLRSLNDPFINNATDAQLIEIGHQTCDILDEGYTVVGLALFLVEQGDFTSAQYGSIGSIIGAAVLVMCPEYQYQIEQLSETY